MSGCLGYLLLVVAALCAEIASIVLIGGQIGATWTVLALAAAVVVGIGVLSGHGIRTLDAVARAMGARRPVGPVVADGALLALAGVLLVLPGFVSDLIALALLVPPVRARVAARLIARFHGGEPSSGAGDADADAIIDTTATERPDTGPELPP